MTGICEPFQFFGYAIALQIKQTLDNLHYAAMQTTAIIKLCHRTLVELVRPMDGMQDNRFTANRKPTINTKNTKSMDSLRLTYGGLVESRRIFEYGRSQFGYF